MNCKRGKFCLSCSFNTPDVQEICCTPLTSDYGGPTGLNADEEKRFVLVSGPLAKAQFELYFQPPSYMTLKQ